MNELGFNWTRSVFRPRPKKGETKIRKALFGRVTCLVTDVIVEASIL